MANIVSYTNAKAKRVRTDCLGELERETVSVINETRGAPVLELYTKDIKTGRTFHVQLSREETEAVARIIYQSGAYGMKELRAKHKP